MKLIEEKGIKYMVKNQELAVQIKEAIETSIEAVLEMHDVLLDGRQEEARELSEDIKEMLENILFLSQKEEEKIWRDLNGNCKNCIASLQNIQKYLGAFSRKAADKIAFELWGILRISYIWFYYFALINPEKERMERFWREEAKDLCKNFFAERAEGRGDYPYDISIYVLAYNNLSYTKSCMEGLLKNFPKDLRCELILVNHGSNDGTKEYFESLHPDKQIDISINDGLGFFAPLFASEGKYMLNISNDVIVTKNAIEIMYACMEENKRVGLVVPATPNISNLQSIAEIEYRDQDELFQKTERYNKRDFKKEEIRTRLCIPIYMVRTASYLNGNDRIWARNFLETSHVLAFGDDKISLLMRRAGYQNILLKDVYCHHFGSATVGNQEKDKLYLDGRCSFYKAYGVDPWERGNWWSYPLFCEKIRWKSDAKSILGIHCGVGSNSLKIKEELKEKTGNKDVQLIHITEEKRFLEDLNAISEKVFLLKNWDSILEKIKNTYDYILVNGGLEGHSYQKILPRLFQAVKRDGILFVMTYEIEIISWIKEKYKRVQVVEDTEYIRCTEREKKTYWAYWYQK